jgi:hypothetical protein
MIPRCGTVTTSVPKDRNSMFQLYFRPSSERGRPTIMMGVEDTPGPVAKALRDRRKRFLILYHEDMPRRGRGGHNHFHAVLLLVAMMSTIDVVPEPSYARSNGNSDGNTQRFGEFRRDPRHTEIRHGWITWHVMRVRTGQFVVGQELVDEFHRCRGRSAVDRPIQRCHRRGTNSQGGKESNRVQHARRYSRVQTRQGRQIHGNVRAKKNWSVRTHHTTKCFFLLLVNGVAVARRRRVVVVDDIVVVEDDVLVGGRRRMIIRHWLFRRRRKGGGASGGGRNRKAATTIKITIMVVGVQLVCRRVIDRGGHYYRTRTVRKTTKGGRATTTGCFSCCGRLAAHRITIRRCDDERAFFVVVPRTVQLYSWFSWMISLFWLVRATGPFIASTTTSTTRSRTPRRAAAVLVRRRIFFLSLVENWRSGWWSSSSHSDSHRPPAIPQIMPIFRSVGTWWWW